MRPLLFHWRNLRVWSYPAMLYLGLVGGTVAGNIAARSLGIDSFRACAATLVLIVAALAGSRLLYVASHWQLYCNDFYRIWNNNEGGGTLYGGFLLTLFLSVPLLRALRLNFGAFWDVAAFTILTGMIFTRMGCLLHGCCAGRPSGNWPGIVLPNSRGIWRKRIPTQVLEAFWAAILLVAAIFLRHSVPFPGALFLLVAAGYASARFLLEFAREREPGELGFTVNRAISLLTALCSISTLAIYWRR